MLQVSIIARNYSLEISKQVMRKLSSGKLQACAMMIFKLRDSAKSQRDSLRRQVYIKR